VEGASIRGLLADPEMKWTTPALTTYGYKNHAVRTDCWRYIRYAGGGEELYDETKDPYEWTNLADTPASAAVKADLAQWLPKTDRREAVGTDGERVKATTQPARPRRGARQGR
jgi:hypothetical protein